MFHYKTETELKHYLAICQLPQIGHAKLNKLFNRFGSFEAIFSSKIDDLIALGFSPQLAQQIQQPNYQQAEQDLAWLTSGQNHHIITQHDPNYPAILQQIAAKPCVLYAKGDINLLATPQVAIVGSRNPSASGLMNTQLLATQLSEQGYTITSGLALGIDAKAHQAALNADGKTIAVIGTGLDTVYPKAHQRLAHLISEKGLMISEFPIHTPARAEHFPRRNRIISGLSLGTLVIEAALKSGSLITARYAIEQNREVFAVPGAIHNPLARGCHALIRQGAKLVESLEDILEELPSLATRSLLKQPQCPNVLELSTLEHTLLAIISHTPIPFDWLVEHTALSTQILTATLTQLELRGLIQATALGYIHISEKRHETQYA